MVEISVGRNEMKKDIYLCGTNHFDLEGPKKLKKVLKKISPDVIAVESNKKDLEKSIKDHKEFLKTIKNIQTGLKKLNDKTNKNLVKVFYSSIGYEMWVSKEYVKKKKIKIVYLEEGFIDKIVKEVIKFLEIKDILKIFEFNIKDFQKKMDSLYKKKTNKKRDKFKLIERNKIFAKKIKEIDGKVLVICGIDHIQGMKPNLRTLLSKYDPEIINLNKK